MPIIPRTAPRPRPYAGGVGEAAASAASSHNTGSTNDAPARGLRRRGWMVAISAVGACYPNAAARLAGALEHAIDMRRVGRSGEVGAHRPAELLRRRILQGL